MPLARSIFLETYRDKNEQNPKEVTAQARQIARMEEQDLTPGEVTEKQAQIVQKWKKKWMSQETEGRRRKNGDGIMQSMPGWRMDRIHEVDMKKDGGARSMKIAFHT